MLAISSLQLAVCGSAAGAALLSELLPQRAGQRAHRHKQCKSIAQQSSRAAQRQRRNHWTQRLQPPRRMKHCILLMHLALARALRAPIRPRAVSRLSSWGGDFDEVSTGDGARKPKRPDTRPDFAKPNYREPRSGRGGRGGGRGRGAGRGRGRNEQTYVRRERQQRHWDAFMEDDANEFVYGIAPVLAALKADRRSKHALYVLEESRRKESRTIVSKHWRARTMWTSYRWRRAC